MTMLGSATLSKSVKDLLFFEKGAMSFREKEIPSEIVTEILKAATSCAWFGKWRLISIMDRTNRIQVVEAWQSGLRRIGQIGGVEFIERWKLAPLFVLFYLPKKFEPYLKWVPPEFARLYAIQEVGTAVRSLELMALTYGIGLHGIMGVLAIDEEVKKVLTIPEEYELVYFGILGYPGEEDTVRFPDLRKMGYAEKWGMPFEEQAGF